MRRAMLLKSRPGDEGQRHDGGHEGQDERETDYRHTLGRFDARGGVVLLKNIYTHTPLPD